MPLTEFEYSKSWRSAEDFPSYEENEERVRDDMQLLFDEVRDALNRTLRELCAAAVPFEATPEIDASTVQNALELVQAQIRNMAAGELPEGTVVTEKLAEGAVTAAKLAAGAVTGDKLAAGAVTGDKLAAGAVGAQALAEGAVSGAALADGAVTAEKLAAGTLSGKADLVSGKVKPEQLSRERVNLTASRALTVGDAGKALYSTAGTGLTLTLPLNSAAPLPIGTELTVFRAGSGEVRFEPAEGVTLRCPYGSPSIKNRYGSARLKKWDANVWALEGEGLAPPGYPANFSQGFAPIGPIRLTEGVHYFRSESQLPAAGQAGRIYLVAME